MRGLSRRILEMDGYTVIEARDGEEAVSEFIRNKDKIHFLLFDLVMPKKNGYRAYEEIRQLNPDIKALFISGYAANILQDKKILEEAINYVSKPISPDTLLNEIEKCSTARAPPAIRSVIANYFCVVAVNFRSGSFSHLCPEVAPYLFLEVAAEDILAEVCFDNLGCPRRLPRRSLLC